MKKVIIIYESMPQYRVPFFNHLKEALQQENIQLIVLYGVRDKKIDDKKDRMPLSWGRVIKNTYIKLPGMHDFIIYQHCLRDVLDADLVIFQQENKYIINYILQFLSLFNRSRKIAFWGHGKNFQAKQTGYNWKESIKRLLIKHVDWWFAYNDMSKKVIIGNGFAPDRITIVNNSIDTRFLKEKMHAYTTEKLDVFRKELGLKEGPIGIYCGTMYPEKRIGFLLEVVASIRKSIPTFEMLFLGDGPDASLVKNISATTPGIHYVGAKFYEDRIPYFLLSDIQLIPGLVGLGIIDSFVFGVPLFTTNYPYHSPEIDYLKNMENGVMVNDNIDEYVNTIVDYLKHKDRLERLKKGCIESSKLYTIENMSNLFAEGVVKALKQY